MKRVSLMLDEHLLSEARRMLHAKTNSAAVNAALTEVLRMQKIRSIPQFFGQQLWKGDLTQMREDKYETWPRAGRRNAFFRQGPDGAVYSD